MAALVERNPDGKHFSSMPSKFNSFRSVTIQAFLLAGKELCLPITIICSFFTVKGILRCVALVYDVFSSFSSFVLKKSSKDNYTNLETGKKLFRSS